MAILKKSSQADGVIIHSHAGARLLLIEGKPLGEPIVQHGPFVINSQQEIFQTVRDFRVGRLVDTSAVA